MAHLPRLLVLFLGIHVSTSHGSPLPPTYDGSMCSESVGCGSVNITYPFYLSNAIGVTNSTSYSCGYTDLKIFCQDDGETGTPVMLLGEHNYTIQDISYDNHTIVLADTDALLGDNCPRVHHNVTFSREWLNYTDSLDSLTFFFDCEPLLGAKDYQINCTGFNSPGPGSGDGISFVIASQDDDDDGPEEHELAGHCREVFAVPIHGDVLMRIDRRTLPWEYGDVLKQGFELAWKPATTQQCYLCERSYGRCAYSEEKQFLGCLCSGEKVGVQDCYSSGASTAPASSKFLTTDPSIFLPSADQPAWHFTGPQLELHGI